jgi:streptomycin 6-kinase
VGSVPQIDAGVRARLLARFGAEAEPWFDQLPELLARLGDAWGITYREAVPRGSVSVVMRCQTVDGTPVVLKATPDRSRLALETKALLAWTGERTPEVLRSDEDAGALLIEEIRPGASLAESGASPDTAAIATLTSALHRSDVLDGSFPDIARRVDYLFSASAKLYERTPGLERIVPRDVYERGHRQAMRLSHDSDRRVLLHGDLTPANILDGGAQGWIAIDPAPCLGDPAFDLIDLLMWRADEAATIKARSEELAVATSNDADRMLAWCSAFAAMTAMEQASGGAAASDAIAAALELASRVPA